MSSAPQRPPFSRLPATDLGSALNAISDLYDKLNVTALKVNSPAPSVPVGAPPPVPASSGALRVIFKSDILTAADAGRTLLAVLPGAATIILPTLKSVQGLAPFTIKNATESGGTLNLQSPDDQKVDGSSAGSYSRSPGQGITLQATALNGWIVLALV